MKMNVTERNGFFVLTLAYQAKVILSTQVSLSSLQRNILFINHHVHSSSFLAWAFYSVAITTKKDPTDLYDQVNKHELSEQVGKMA